MSENWASPGPIPWNSIRGVEATPIVVDGIMYVTAPGPSFTQSTPRPAKSSGRSIPSRPASEGYRLCCDVVNRGVAVYKGKVYVGTPDARLIALDAATGQGALEH